MNFGEFHNGKAQQPLPLLLKEREAELNQFHDYCHDLMLKILGLFAIGLKIDETGGGSQFLWVFSVADALRIFHITRRDLNIFMGHLSQNVTLSYVIINL